MSGDKSQKGKAGPADVKGGAATSAGMVASMKAALSDAAARLAGRGQETTPAPTDIFRSPDPTKALMPGAAMTEGERARQPVGGDLRDQLQTSGRNILGHQKTVNSHARQLYMDISAREGGWISILANFTRFFVVAYWLYLAWQLRPLRATGGATPFGDMAPVQATALFDIFIKLGAIGAAGAMLGILISFMLGNADNNRLRATARQFGTSAAKLARDFDSSLSDVRQAMDDHKHEYVKAIKALSQGHLTATETAAFFSFLPILYDGSDEREERKKFDGFLRRAATGLGEPPSTKILALFLGLILGVLFGVIYGFLTWAPKPEIATDIQSLLQLFPNAASAVLLPAIAYGAIGMVYDLFRNGLSAPIRQQALTDSLDAVRAPFTGMDAPRMNDIAQRIVDALDVYIGNVRGEFGRAHGTDPKSNHAGNFSSENRDEPEWRRRDSSVKFVDTDFSATPKRWRVDYPKKN